MSGASVSGQPSGQFAVSPLRTALSAMIAEQRFKYQHIPHGQALMATHIGDGRFL
jgi:hypothetical protein